jgi:SAM-dependent methyltransferase
MKTWPIYLESQAEAPYGKSYAQHGAGPNTLELHKIVRECLGRELLMGPSLIVGAGGPFEVSSLYPSFPGELFALTSHAPEQQALRSLLGERALLGDMHEMPFPSGKFGFVYASCTLEHAISPYVALLECRRVLRPKELAYFTFPSFEGSEGGRGPYHLHCLDLLVWKELLRKTGHEVFWEKRQPGSDDKLSHYDHVLCRATTPPPPHDEVLRKIEKAHE